MKDTVKHDPSSNHDKNRHTIVATIFSHTLDCEISYG